MKKPQLTQMAVSAVFLGYVLLCGVILVGGAMPGWAATTALTPTSTTATTSTGTGASSIEDPCDREDDKSFVSEMEKARQADIAARMAAWSESAAQATDAARKALTEHNLKTPLGDIRLTMCLDYINKFYDLIQFFLTKANAIIYLIKTIIEELLQAVCNYVAATINNALTAICLPLPDLGLGALGLGHSSQKTCDGISLKDMMYVATEPPYVVPGTVPRFKATEEGIWLSRSVPKTGTSQ